jgi:hypothetical protein
LNIIIIEHNQCRIHLNWAPTLTRKSFFHSESPIFSDCRQPKSHRAFSAHRHLPVDTTPKMTSSLLLVTMDQKCYTLFLKVFIRQFRTHSCDCGVSVVGARHMHQVATDFEH